MFTPSLTLILCLTAPVLAAWSAWQANPPHRPYLLAAIPHWLAAQFSASGRGNISHLVLSPEQTVEIALLPVVPLITAAMLSFCALLVWLQTFKGALAYPHVLRWIAVPLSLAAASTPPLMLALPFLSGVLKWAFAAPAIKALGMLGLMGFAATGLALMTFMIQLVISMIRAARTQNKAA